MLGISVDHIPCLQAWAESLGGVSFPLLSDFWPHGEIASLYGILGDDGRSERAIYILDHEGVLRFERQYGRDEAPDLDLILKTVQSIDSGGRPAESEPQAAPELPHGGIVMYCSPYCSDCRQARAWLDERGIHYTEVDVYRVQGASEQVRAWNDDNLVLPTFDVEGEVFSNFEPEQLTSILQKYRLMPGG